MAARHPLPTWPTEYAPPRLIPADTLGTLSRGSGEDLVFEDVPQVEHFAVFTYLWPSPPGSPDTPGDAAPLQQPYLLGAQVRYRQEWHLLGHALGELLYSLPLAPGEEATIEVLSWDRNVYKREEEITSDLEREVKENQSYKDSREVLRDIQKTKKWYASGKGSVSILDIVKVDADPGGISRETAEIHRNAQQTILESVDTAGSRLYTQHKTSISTTREFGREDRVTRKVTNTNRCHPVTYLFFEVLRNYKLRTALATPAARPCIFVKQRPPIQRAELLVEPFEYYAFLRTLRWLHQHSHLIAEALLDRSFFKGLDVLPKLVAYWSLRRGLAASGNFDSELQPMARSLVAGTDYVRVAAVVPWDPESFLLHNLRTQIETHAPWIFDAIVTGPDSVHAALGSGADGALTQAVDRLLAKHAQYYPHTPESFRDLFESLQLGRYIHQPLMRLKADFARLVYGPAPGEEPDPAHLALMTEVAEAVRLMRHVEQNHLHYFQAVWAARDPGEVLLEASSAVLPWDSGVRVADVIEPVPLGFYADYAVFPYTQADEDSLVAQLVRSFIEHEGDPPRESEIVLPTSGIVVEAQLGKTNACEPFIREHRQHDLALKAEEVAQGRVETHRRHAKVERGELDNPECCPRPPRGWRERLCVWWHGTPRD